MTHELGFIGAGNMAEAIARAAIDGGVLAAANMIACDPVEDRRRVFATLGVATCEQNSDVIARSRYVLLAVKPQTLPQVGDELRAIDADGQVVMSIMAGITTEKIEQAIGRPSRLVRIMPNTPLMVGRGMSAITLGRHARHGDDDLALRLFAAAGEAIRVEERMIDAITAVSGSGPAYLFYLAEAMEQAAKELGLTEHAGLLVRQTLLGSAELLASGEQTPQELRRKVTSPGGTTEAAIMHLDGNASVQVIVNAIKAAQERSRELGG